ncbi:MAG: hypothetical protein ACLFSK_10025, partial [Ectothiorhodospira sp.]
RTEIMRAFPYPVFPGERHTRPGLIVNRMSHAYDFIFTNVSLLVVRHMSDGITANRRRIQQANPQGYRIYFLEEIRDNARFSSRKALFSYYQRYVRMSLGSGMGLTTQWVEVPDRMLWFKALPGALLAHFRDRMVSARP